MLFGINQGGTFDDIRIEHMQRIAELDLPGYDRRFGGWREPRRNVSYS